MCCPTRQPVNEVFCSCPNASCSVGGLVYITATRVQSELRPLKANGLLFCDTIEEAVKSETLDLSHYFPDVRSKFLTSEILFEGLSLLLVEAWAERVGFESATRRH